MSYRSPLAKARGLGSAKDGVGHWWMQRVTSVALVPLVLWLIFGIAMLGHADYETLTGWVGKPSVAIALLILVLAVFHHAALGIQVVAEDYIPVKWQRLLTVVAMNFVCVVAAVISIFAILKIAFGTGS